MMFEDAKRRGARLLVVALGVAFAAAGCGASDPPSPGGPDQKLNREMGDLYGLYVREHGGRSPKDEQEFREFLNGKQEIIERMGITVDKMFVSPRGDAPLEWVYGATPPRGSTGMTYIGYEKTSVDGKRFVMAAGGMHEMIDEAQFRKLFPNAH
jgi:hypothetical protein